MTEWIKKIVTINFKISTFQKRNMFIFEDILLIYKRKSEKEA